MVCREEESERENEDYYFLSGEEERDRENDRGGERESDNQAHNIFSSRSKS